MVAVVAPAFPGRLRFFVRCVVRKEMELFTAKQGQWRALGRVDVFDSCSQRLLRTPMLNLVKTGGEAGRSLPTISIKPKRKFTCCTPLQLSRAAEKKVRKQLDTGAAGAGCARCQGGGSLFWMKSFKPPFSALAPPGGVFMGRKEMEDLLKSIQRIAAGSTEQPSRTGVSALDVI